MSLFEKTASVISFNVLQTVLSKAISALQIVILVRLLTNVDIGTIGLAGGVMAVVSFLALSPEVAFLRDYPKMKSALHEYISAFLAFGALRGLVILALLYVGHGFNPGLGDIGFQYLLLFALANGLTLLTGPFREAFYGEFRQARIAFVDIPLNTLALVSLALVFVYPATLTYGFVQVGVALVSVLYWYFQARKHLGFSFVIGKNWMKYVMNSLRGFSLWNHFTSSSIRLAYQADIFILGYFVGLDAIGDYAIALTLANLFVTIPQLVQKAVTLSFSRVEKTEALCEGLGLAVKYTFLFSIFQLLGFWLLGKPMLEVVGVAHPSAVFEYAFYLLLGITFYNFARPWVGILIAKYDAKKLFFELFAWFGILAVTFYYAAATLGGALGVAQANVLMYALFALGTIAYATLRLRVVPRISFISVYERQLVAKWFPGK